MITFWILNDNEYLQCFQQWPCTKNDIHIFNPSTLLHIWNKGVRLHPITIAPLEGGGGRGRGATLNSKSRQKEEERTGILPWFFLGPTQPYYSHSFHESIPFPGWAPTFCITLKEPLFQCYWSKEPNRFRLFLNRISPAKQVVTKRRLAL